MSRDSILCLHSVTIHTIHVVRSLSMLDFNALMWLFQAKWHYRMKCFYFFTEKYFYLFARSSENRKCWFDIVYSKKNSPLAVPRLPAGLGVASMLIALLVRVLFTYICVLCAGFNVKEKAFIALAWMPKATVQVCAHSLNLVLLDFFQWGFEEKPVFPVFFRRLSAPRL